MVKLLMGRYELVEKIGEGGMAVVYKAKDRLLNRYVAIKTLRPEYTRDAQFVDSFRRESQAAAGLEHPNIISIYDVGREGNIHFIVMEYIDGMSLSDVIKVEAPMDYKAAISIAKQIASALSMAHHHNIIHRDVKPHNIMMKSDGTQLRSYVYCLDCAAAIIKALIRGESGKAYNIAAPSSVISIRELDGEQFILYPKTAEPAIRDFQLKNLRDSSIRYTLYESDTSVLFSKLLVPIGKGLLLYTHTLDLPPNTVCIPVTDLPYHASICFFYLKGSTNPDVTAFVKDYLAFTKEVKGL